MQRMRFLRELYQGLGKIGRKILITIVWWPTLGLNVLFFTLLTIILPGKKHNGFGLCLAATILLKVAGIRVDVKGAEHIQRGRPQIFIVNHQSWFDSFVLCAILKVPVTFISKKEMFRVPVYNCLMKHLHFISVDRNHPRGILKQLSDISALFHSEISLIIYPEGSRSKSGEVGVFRRGGLFFASSANVPVVPITLIGTRDIMPYGQYWIKYGRRVKVIISEPIDIGKASKKRQLELTEEIRQQIIKNLEENKKWV